MKNIQADELKQLQSEGKKIVVDFWAKWCGPCKALIPRLESIESQYSDVTFVKIDVDENMDISLDMGIRSVPTVIIYDGDKLVNRSTGAQPDTFYKDILEKL